MTSKFGKMIGMIFAISILQSQLLAAPPIMGKLRTRNNKPVSVNGHKATSGTTVLSGSRIEIPEKIGATVDLGPLGRIDIAPNTDLTVMFDASKVAVQLKAGYVVLTTKKGIHGTVTTPDGSVFATDESKLSSVVARTAGAQGPEAAVPIGAAVGGLGGTAGVVGASGAVVGGTAAVTSNGRGSDLSSDNPRQP